MRDALGDMGPEQLAELRLELGSMSTRSTMSTMSAISTKPVFAARKLVTAKAALLEKPVSAVNAVNPIVKHAAPFGVVLPYKPGIRKTAQTRATLKMVRAGHASAAAR